MEYIIFGVLILLFVGILISTSSQNNTTVNQNKPFVMFADYIGGCSTIYDTNFRVYISVKDGMLQIESQIKKVDFYVSLHHIIKATMTSEEEIKNQITLGRIALLGAFALVAPRKKKEIRKFAMIKYYNDKTEEETIVLESSNIGRLVEKIMTLKNEELNSEVNLNSNS